MKNAMKNVIAPSSNATDGATDERGVAATRVGNVREVGVGGAVALAAARAEAVVLALTLDEFEREAAEALEASDARADELENAVRTRDAALEEAHERVDALVADLAAARDEGARAVRAAELAGEAAIEAAIEEFLSERETLERRMIELESDMEERALLAMHQMDDLRAEFDRKEAKLKKEVEKLRIAANDAELVARVWGSKNIDCSRLEQEIATCEVEKHELLQEISRLRERLRAVSAE